MFIIGDFISGVTVEYVGELGLEYIKNEIASYPG